MFISAQRLNYAGLFCQSVIPSIHPFASQSVRHSVNKSSGPGKLSISLAVLPPTHPSVCQSVSQSVSQSFRRSARPSAYNPLRPSVSQSVSAMQYPQRFHLGKTKYFITCYLNCTLSHTSLTEEETILKILISATGHIEN